MEIAQIGVSAGPLFEFRDTEDLLQPEQLSGFEMDVLPGGLSRGPLRAEPLCGDGSDRRFFRIRQGPRRWVLLLSPRKQPEGIIDENDSYYLIGNHLAERGLPVPKMILADPNWGRFLMEDVGDCYLERIANHGRRNIGKFYMHAIRLLIQLHCSAREGFDSKFCFDTAVYDPRFILERELEYFRKSFLSTYLGVEIPFEELGADFRHMAEIAGAPGPPFAMHRDFQSRNLMVCNGLLRLIDFQGMRFGPPSYDLASLLLDPYVRIPPTVQEELSELYWRGAREFLGCSRADFRRSYEATRLCRNLQVLGAYGFLGVEKRKSKFLRHIPAAWTELRRWLHGPCRGLYPALRQLVESINLTHTPSAKGGSARFRPNPDSLAFQR
jgi:N-acetylmuramate 1-kinase